MQVRKTLCRFVVRDTIEEGMKASFPGSAEDKQERRMWVFVELIVLYSNSIRLRRQSSILIRDLYVFRNQLTIERSIPVSIIKTILAHAANTTSVNIDVANVLDTIAAALVLTNPRLGAHKKANIIPNTRVSKMKTDGNHIIVPS
jgi:hypothetical protein